MINCGLNNETREGINREYFALLIWAEICSFFLFCSDFHIDLTKHTAPWLPAEQTQPPGRRQAWLCSDKDMLNSASHYLHFFFLPGFTQIERYADQQRLMKAGRNELKQWSLMCLLLTPAPDWTVKTSQKPVGGVGWNAKRKKLNGHWVR